MAILLIGARGQLGSDLIALAPDLFHPWSREEVDLLDLKGLENKLQEVPCQAIVNVAAYNQTEKAQQESSVAYTVNGHAVGVMGKSAEKKKIPLVHVSTDFVFDGKKRSPYLETDLPAPLSVYGASKALGEAYALSSCPQAYVLRTAALYGKQGSRQKKGNFVETLLQKGRGDGPIQVVSDITMSPTSTLSLAKAILDLLRFRPEPGLYHAVNGGEASWFTFAKRIGEKGGFAEKIVPVSHAIFPSKIVRPLYSVLCNEKILKTLTLPAWEEALDEYLQ